MAHIRPLTEYKKYTGKLYDYIIDLFDAKSRSKKHQENTFYWYYGVSNSGIREVDHYFFFTEDDKNTRHVTTVTEMGRLLLHGWYYNIEGFVQQVCRYVYNGYLEAKDRGKDINDAEFAGAVKHIRENLGFYYHNENELKVYLIKNFFYDEAKPMLPEPPEEVKEFDEIIELIRKEKERRLKEDPDYYVKRAGDLEGYTEYLQQLLDEHGIDYKSLERHQEEDKQWLEDWINEVEEAAQEHDEEVKKRLLETKMLT